MSTDANAGAPRCAQDQFATIPPTPPGGSDALPAPSPAAEGEATERAADVPGYLVLGELGRGGMGVVYKVRQAGLNRICALKMILHGGHAGADELTRFRTEAEAIARLQHPNIVAVYEVGEHDGRPFFSLEYCPGGSLDRKLAGNPLPAGEAAKLVEVLARAMHAAHTAHVVHRDLKPANVLLAADGTPKITDFGLAKKLDEAGQTQSGAIMGTPSYMAPEQAGGKSKDVGPAADIYALGAILYECLTGRPPFKAATPLDTLLQVIHDEPVPPTQLQSRTPRDLETICLKCLHKEAGKRYATAEDLADDLRRWQAGEPIKARPVGRVARAWRWCKRNPLVTASLVTAALALSATVLLAGWANYQDRKRAEQDRERAAQDRERVEQDAARTREELGKERERRRQSLLEQARAQRVAGNRQRALELIAEAAGIEQTDTLRQEAIQVVTSPGIKFTRELNIKHHDLDAVLPLLPRYGFPRQRRRAVWEELASDRPLPADVLPAGCAPVVRSTGWENDRWCLLSRKVQGKPGREVVVWDVLRRRVVSTLPAHLDPPEFGFISSPDGRWLALQDRDDPRLIRLWDCWRNRVSGSLAFKTSTGPILWPHWGTTLTGPLKTPAGEAFESRTRVPGNPLADFDPKGIFLASGWKDNVVRLDEVATGRHVTSVPGLVARRWSSAGRYLLTSSDRPIEADTKRKQGHSYYQVWEVVHPVANADLREPISNLVFRADGRQLAVNGTVWDVLPGSAAPKLDPTGIEMPGQRVGFAGREVWAIPHPDRRPSGTHDPLLGVVGLVGFPVLPGNQSPFSLAMCCAAGLPTSWRRPLIQTLPPGRDIFLPLFRYRELLERVAEGHRRLRQAKGARAVARSFAHWRAVPVAWNADGSVIAVRVDGGRINHHVGGHHSYGWFADASLFELWQRTSGKRQALFSTTGRRDNEALPAAVEALDAAFQPNGERLAFVWPRGGGLSVRIVNAREGKVIQEVPGADGASWSHDGKSLLLLRKSDGMARVLDADGHTVHEWSGPAGKMSAFTMNKDGRWVVTGEEDGLLHVRDVKTGRDLARWQAHDAPITALAFSPDGKLLASGARDGTLRIWNLPWIREALTKLGLDW